MHIGLGGDSRTLVISGERKEVSEVETDTVEREAGRGGAIALMTPVMEAGMHTLVIPTEKSGELEEVIRMRMIITQPTIARSDSCIAISGSERGLRS